MTTDSFAVIDRISLIFDEGKTREKNDDSF